MVNSGLLIAPKPHPFALTFTKPGTYRYQCSIHHGMEGTITVLPAGREAGAPWHGGVAGAAAPATPLSSCASTAIGTALLAALLAALLGSLLARGSTSAPATSPPVDPRLVLHAHHVAIPGTLAGPNLRGSLYPGFPGVNTI